MKKVEILSDNAVSLNYGSGDSSRCCAFPVSSMTGKDEQVVVYRSGQTKHSADGILLMQTTKNGGADWSEPGVVYDGTGLRPRQTVVTGGIGVTADGVWIAAIGTVEGLSDDAYMFSPGIRRSLKRRIFLLRSGNRGATWSDPELLSVDNAPGAGIVTAPFRLPSGEFAVPLERPASSGTQGTAIVFSSDRGRTFGDVVTVASDRTGKLNYADGRFLILNNGNILCTLWTFRQDTEETISIHSVFSSDQGKNWTEPASMGVTGQVNSSIQIPGGTLLLAANVRTPPVGSRLWISTDGGITWPAEMCHMLWDPAAGMMRGEPIGPGEMSEESGPDEGVWSALQKFNFGTPTLNLHSDGILVLTYWAEVDGVTHIRSSRIRLHTG